MEVEFGIRRLVFEKEYTEGWFLDESGNWMGDSLEDRTRDFNKDGDLGEPGEEKVYGKTAIPFGRHEVRITFSPKFKKNMPQVMIESKSHDGIRIHFGATAKNSLGCPLAGAWAGNGRLKDNGAAKAINDAITRHIKEGNKVFLKVF